MKGRGTALLLALVTAVSLLSGVRQQAAHADDTIPTADPSLTPAVQADIDWQASVTDLTNKLWATGAKDLDFAGVSLNFETHSVEVYSTRPVLSPKFRLAIGTNPAAPVVFKKALMSARQTKVTFDKVDAKRAALAAQGFDVTSITSDLVGPVVLHIPRTGDVSPQAAIAAATTAATTARVSTSSVKIVADGEPDTLTDSRNWDTGDYDGGAWIKSASGSHTSGPPGSANCSSGFGAKSNVNGKFYVLTAYHCVKPNDMRLWTQANSYVGKVSVVDGTRDTVFVPVDTGHRMRPMIWQESWSAGLEQRMGGTAHYNLRQYICTSGAMSGQRCAMTHGGLMRHHYCNDFVGGKCYTGDYYFAASDNGSSLVAEGDSGGPVYLPFRIPMSGALALGIMHAGNHQLLPSSRCGNVRDDWARCFSTVIFSDVGSQLTSRRMTLAW